MWDLPGLGIEPVPPALAGWFLTTAPPGKSYKYLLNEWNLIYRLGGYFWALHSLLEDLMKAWEVVRNGWATIIWNDKGPRMRLQVTRLLEHQSSHTQLAKREISDDEQEGAQKMWNPMQWAVFHIIIAVFCNNFSGNWQQAFKSAISSSEFLSKE